MWVTRRGQQLVCVKSGEAGGSAHQVLKMGMQVRRMLKGEMACPTDRAKRKKWAEEEATLQAIVRGNLASNKTKWYTVAEQ